MFMTLARFEIKAKMQQGNGTPAFYVDPVEGETIDEFLQSIAEIAVESRSFTALVGIEDLTGKEIRELTNIVADSMQRMRDSRS